MNENERKLEILKDRLNKLFISLEKLEINAPQQSLMRREDKSLLIVHSRKIINLVLQEHSLSDSSLKEILKILWELLVKLKNSLREVQKEILDILQELYKL
jgi:hypothetical protein